MKNRAKLLGTIVLAALIGFSMAGCAAAPPPTRPTTEVFRAPWSAYTLIPSQDYVVVGAIALRNVDRTTFLVDLMEQAIEMGGHDLINVRLAVTGAGTITGATAVVIRYTDETISIPVYDFSPGGDFVTLFGVPAREPAPGVRPARVVRVPWSVYATIPGKRHVTVGAIALRGANHATLLVDLKERAIEMGGHDIINVRLTITDTGAITGATAVAIKYTDETIYRTRHTGPKPEGARVETPGTQDARFASLLPGGGRRAERPPRAPRPPRPPRDRSRVNWLSGNVHTWGFGIRYERDISDVFAVGGAGFLGTTLDADTDVHGIMGTVRFFPGGFPFYLELGLGLGGIVWEDVSASGLMVTPAIGLRLGGQARNIFVNPFVNLPMASNGSYSEVAFTFGVGLGAAW